MIKLANASSGKNSEEEQVKICNYYDKQWDFIIRPSSNIVNKLITIAEQICNNNNVLYSQAERLTLYRYLSSNNYDVSKIKEKVYCDCSSFVGTCLKAVGVQIDIGSFTTSTMRSILSQKGFAVIKFETQNQLQKGDILVKEGSHTVLVISSDSTSTTSTSINKTSGKVYLSDKKSYLNVREKPSATSKVVGALNYDDEVKILSQVDNWYYINKDNIKGYCSKNYII